MDDLITTTVHRRDIADGHVANNARYYVADLVTFDTARDFLTHLHLWRSVVAELHTATVYRRVDANNDTNNNNTLLDDLENWNDECDDHRRSWKAVDAQLRDVTPLIPAANAVTTTPITHP